MNSRPLLVAGALLVAACESSLPTRSASAPVWSVGDSWTVAAKSLRQQEMSAGASSWTDERTFSFLVNGHGTLDGVPAFRVLVEDDAAGDRWMTLYFRADDKQLLRIEESPRNARGGAKSTTVNLYGESWPVVSDDALLGLAVPAFGKSAGTFSYDGVMEGIGGFGGVVEQHVDGSVITLRRGDLVVTQTWEPGKPWATTQDVGGRTVARLVSFERKAADTALTAAESAFEIETSDATASEWPTEGTARFEPWSFAIPHPEGEAGGVWSGHWWPMLEGGSGRLYSDGGPMEKYDSYLQAKNGTSPRAKAWELANHKTTDSKNTWWGHCNGLAAASILEDEPKTAGAAHGVTFTVGDKKGLLTEINNGGGLDLWVGSRVNDENDTTSAAFKDVKPYDFHRTLVQWIGINREPVIMDLNAGFQVWNYPVFKYRMSTSPHSEPNKLNVTTTIWKVNFSSENHVGVSSSQQTYTYWVTIDPNGNPIAGASEWTGSSVNDHPDFIWHPNGRGTGAPIQYPIVKEIAELGSTPAGDDHPNTAAATGANDVITEAGVAGVFETAGDVDYFRFQAESGFEYTLLTSQLAGGADTYIHLVGADGTTELRSDDDGGVEQYASKLVWLPQTAGVHYVRVRHYSPSGVGSYRIALSKRAVGGGDDRPNTAAETRPQDVIGAAGLGGAIETAGDVDFFRFEAVAGKTYVIETYSLSSTMDTYLYLHDATGAELKKDDDSGSQRYASKITWTAPASGTFYAKVKHYSATKTGTYAVKVTQS